MSELTSALGYLGARVKELELAEYWLGELLAAIHRDGGHYMDYHGIAKASKDAIAKWYERDALSETDGSP